MTMDAIECPNCGSTEFEMQDDFFHCDYCRSKFVPANRVALTRDSVIGLSADVQTLLEKCEVDPTNRRRYANLILDIDPHNQEARKFLS